MLSTLVAAATKLIVAGGAINDPDSALFKPAPKYTHGQIVGGLIFDITVTCLLLFGLALVSYRTWGPPSRQAGDDATTLKQEGLLLGVQPWIWSIGAMVAVTVTVLGSVIFYG